MGRRALRIVGGATGGYALLVAASAAVFRMDTAGELRRIVRVDVVVGLALAVAVALFRIPAADAGTRRRHGLTALAAVTVWAVVSGGLAWSHLEQHRIRSNPPAALGD